MNLHALKLFYEAARRGSVTRAAAALIAELRRRASGLGQKDEPS